MQKSNLILYSILISRWSRLGMWMCNLADIFFAWQKWKCKQKRGKKERKVAPRSLLFRPLATRGPRSTGRGLSLSPERAQPPPGGSRRSTRLLLTSPLRCAGASADRTAATAEDSLRLTSDKRDLNPRRGHEQTQAPVASWSASLSRKWFTWSFPPDGEKFGELERKDAAERRFKWREGESPDLDQKSSTRYLFFFFVVV